MCRQGRICWMYHGEMYSSSPARCWQFDSFIYCFNIDYLEILNFETSRTPGMRLQNKVSKCQRGFFIFNINHLTVLSPVSKHSVLSLLWHRLQPWSEGLFQAGVGPHLERSDHRPRQTSVIRLRRVTTIWRKSLRLFELSEVREVKKGRAIPRSEATTDLARILKTF